MRVGRLPSAEKKTVVKREHTPGVGEKIAPPAAWRSVFVRCMRKEDGRAVGEGLYVQTGLVVS